MTTSYLQQNQPPGVPPLELTGERTLPDVPEENYWYRRHLVVYEWIARRSEGLRVADMACGEGYGSAAIAKRAREVVAVDANPEAHEHARLKYAQPNLAFHCDLVERFEDGAPFDVITFLQTVEHVESPGPLLERLSSLLVPNGLLYVSTPNRLTLAPPGKPRSDNPWHLREYDAAEFSALVAPRFEVVELLGVFHARKLLVHASALGLGGDRLHRRLGLTDRFYGWFVPSISERDFAVRKGRLARALDLVGVCHV